MKRVIKFRAWDSNNKVMVTEDNIYELTEKYDYEKDEYWTSYVRYWMILDDMPEWFYRMQYTWINDKDWKEIYEWDVVERWVSDDEMYVEIIKDIRKDLRFDDVMYYKILWNIYSFSWFLLVRVYLVNIK